MIKTHGGDITTPLAIIKQLNKLPEHAVAGTVVVRRYSRKWKRDMVVELTVSEPGDVLRYPIRLHQLVDEVEMRFLQYEHEGPQSGD